MSTVTYTKWIGKKANGRAADSDYNAFILELAEGNSLIPTGSTITDLEYRVQAYTATYSSSRTFKVTDFYIGNSNGPQRASASDSQDSGSLEANGWQGLQHGLDYSWFTSEELISDYFDSTTINVAFGLSTSNGADCWINGIQVYIEYTTPAKPTAPTTVIIDDTTPYPGQPLSLSWSGATYTSPNTIDSYNIYRNGTYLKSSPSSPCSVTASSENGGSYKYTIVTVGKYSNSSQSTASATAITTVSTPTTITSLTCNDLTALYLGNTFSSLILKWEGASAGTYNSTISGYRIYQGNTLIHTCGTETQFDLTTLNLESYIGTYTIETIAGYGSIVTYSGKSTATVTISQLSFTNNSENNFAFKSTPEEKVSGNITYTWSEVTANNGTVKYAISCISDGKDIFSDLITQTSYSFDISNTEIKPGANFTFSVTPVIYSDTSGGGAISGNTISSTSSRSSSFYFPENFWLEYYNPDYQNSSNKAQCGWEQVLLKWAVPQTEDTISHTYTYTLKYRLVNSEQIISDKITNNFYTVNFSQYSDLQEGTQIFFSIVATDQYKITQTSPELSFMILSRPNLSNLSIEKVNETEIQPKFSWQFTTSAESELQYRYILKYNNQTFTYTSDDYIVNIGSVYNTIQDILSVQLLSSYNDSNANVFWKEIYNTVITQQIPQPEIQITVILSSKVFFKEENGKFFGCYSSINIPFQLNYLDSNFEILIPTLKLNKITNPEIEYYNPEDLLECQIESLNWLGVTGEGKGATITYILSRTNFEKTFTENDLISPFQDTIIQTDSDITLNYFLQAKLTYENNGTPISLYSQKRQESIKVARWNNLDNINLINCKIVTIGSEGEVKRGFAGQISLPSLYPCGSIVYANITQCQFKIENSFNDTIINLNVICKENQYDKIDFFIEFNQINGIYEEPATTTEIFGNVIITNTSGKTFEKILNIYQIRLAASTISFRKNRVGINVNEDFSDFEPVISDRSGTRELIKNEDVSALYINAKLGADSAPVVEINTNAEGKQLMNYLSSGNLISSVQIRNKNALTITNLSTTTSINLISSNWSGNAVPYIYRINDDYITTDTIQEILPNPSISSIELKTFQKANIIGGSQGNGYCELICFGTVPTIDIPIIMIIRGG